MNRISRLPGQPSDRPTAGLSNRPLIIIGAGGFGREVLWICRRAGLEVAGFCDDAPDRQTGSVDGLPLLGAIEQAARAFGPGTGFHCAVGSNRARQQLVARALAAGWQPVTVVDPSAIIAPDARMGDGVFVGPLSVISCCTSIGNHVLVNQQTSIGHDAQIAAFAQICPGACVSGECVVGEGAFLGSNAVLLPGKHMGAWSVLGANALGLSDIADEVTVARVR